MQTVRRAVIDVGTNSIRLLVADVAGREVSPILEESWQTRLGQGFYETHRLSAAAISRTAEAVAVFAEKARSLQSVSIRAIATSAARDAVNPGDLLEAVRHAAGLRLEIITGEQEADWAFQGVTSGPASAQDPLLLLEAGGGSTQFILGQSDHKHFCESFPVGTVRLLEKLPHSDPPLPAELAACRKWLAGFLRREVSPRLRPAMEREIHLHPRHGALNLIGTGGTASILGCMEARLDHFDRSLLESTRVSRDGLRTRVEQLWGLPLAERRTLVGLPPNRADVILTGAAIYEAVMDEFGFAELRISTRGLRFAALMEG